MPDFIFRSIFAMTLLVTALSTSGHACTTLAWDQVSGAELSAQAEAAYEGQCGLRLNLGSGASWVEDQTPGTLVPAVSQYAARFYLYADDASLPTGTALTLLQAQDTSQAELFALELLGTSQGNRLMIRAHHGSGTTSSGQIELPRGWRSLEARWLSGSGNGSLILALDGVDRLSLTSLDTGGTALGRTRLGLVAGAASGQSGWLDVDAFASRRSGSNGLAQKTCSGGEVAITDTTFLPGSHSCVGTNSLTLGERVTLDAGASLNLTAPLVVLAAGTHIGLGAQLSVNHP